MEPDACIDAARRLARPYRLVPPTTGLGGVAGSFLGRREGGSIDFHDYRQYHPGDDLRRVDWRAYARSKQMHLRLFREEVSPLVELHLDTSASMGHIRANRLLPFSQPRSLPKRRWLRKGVRSSALKDDAIAAVRY